MIERTLIVIKPDGMPHAKKIIDYYTKAGLRIIARKEIHIDKKFAEKHYAATDEQIIGMGNKTIQASKDSGNYEKMKKIFGTEDPKKMGMKLRDWLIKFITSKPVLALVLEGGNAVALARKITGFTDPAQADKGTIRGDLGTDSIVSANADGRPVRNLVHASGNASEAERELALWFPELLATKILLDTNIYGWAVEDIAVLTFLSKLEKEKKNKSKNMIVFGFDRIKKELLNNPHEPTRIKTLVIYSSVVSNILKRTDEVKALAESYFRMCKDLKVKITIEDCEIVAAATLNGLDYIVTNNRRTMNSPHALDAFKKINTGSYETPEIIDSKEAITRFSS